MLGQGAEAREEGPEDTELYFLVLSFLRSGPCSEAADCLERESNARGLLPTRIDVNGATHCASYAQLAAQYAHVPPRALAYLLRHVATANQQRDVPGASSTASLLAPGRLAALPLPPGAPPRPAPAPWMRPPHTACASIAQRLLLRETGARVRQAAPLEYVARRFAHQRTCRGHRLPVYCVAYENAGRRVITGSDDYLVKIWSAGSGLLLRTCRGHEAEITDICVSRDDRLVASASQDMTIRCVAEGWCKAAPVCSLVQHCRYCVCMLAVFVCLLCVANACFTPRSLRFMWLHGFRIVAHELSLCVDPGRWNPVTLFATNLHLHGDDSPSAYVPFQGVEPRRGYPGAPGFRAAGPYQLRNVPKLQPRRTTRAGVGIFRPHVPRVERPRCHRDAAGATPGKRLCQRRAPG